MAFGVMFPPCWILSGFSLLALATEEQLRKQITVISDEEGGRSQNTFTTKHSLRCAWIELLSAFVSMWQRRDSYELAERWGRKCAVGLMGSVVQDSCWSAPCTLTDEVIQTWGFDGRLFCAALTVKVGGKTSVGCHKVHVLCMIIVPSVRICWLGLDEHLY